jgi:RND family efflux transporter MFP subunit
VVEESAEGGGEHGHGHGHEHETAEIPLDRLEEQRCEHGMRQLDCDECRYELGVVKIPPGLSKDLLASVQVRRDPEGKRILKLRCEVAGNPTRSTPVVALKPGRVIRVARGLGDKVVAGEPLARIHSEAFGREGLAHLQAHQELDLAAAQLARVEALQAHLSFLLAALEAPASAPLDVAAFDGLVVGSAKGELVAAANAVGKARKDLERERERIRNARGLLDALARKPGDLDPASFRVGDWKGPLLEEQANLTLARSTLQREQELARKGASTLGAVQTAERDVAAARARLAAAQEQVRLDLERTAVAFETRLADAEARFQAQVEQAGLGLDVELLEARQKVEGTATRVQLADQSMALLGYTRAETEALDSRLPSMAEMEVRAPSDGMIVEQEVAPGRWVEEGGVLFTVADPDDLWVWCRVPQRELAALAAAGLPLETTVRSEAIPGAAFAGRLDYVERSVAEQTRTVGARVRLTGSGGRLLPGMFVTGEVAAPSGKGALVVPESALVRDGDETFVFLHWKDQLWARRAVEVGARDGELVTVLSGLKEGDEIASGGTFFLKSDVLRERMGAGCAD